MQIEGFRQVIREVVHQHLRVELDEGARELLRELLADTANRIHEAGLLDDPPELRLTYFRLGLYVATLNATAISDFRGVASVDCMRRVRDTFCPMWPIC